MNEALGKSSVADIAVIDSINDDVVRIKIRKDIDPNQLVGELHRVIDTTFAGGASQIVLDLENVDFPNASFVAMLIGKTSEARRWGGDIRIMHISETARNHLGIFSALTYLSIGREYSSAGEEILRQKSPSEDDLILFDDGKPCRLEVEASIDSLNKVTDFVVLLAERAGLEPLERSKLKLAVYEAGMNVVEHGYQFAPDELLAVEVQKDGRKLVVTIIDNGPAFDIYSNHKYDVESAFHDRKKGGFGVQLIRQSVDEVRYKHDKSGNRLTLIKTLGK